MRRYQMSMRRIVNNRGPLVVAGVLFGILMAVQVCFAGGAATIVQDKHLLAPRGSYIPERRAQQVLKKVEEHKAVMKAKKATQHEKQLQESDKPKP
jgi:hypothetical protein